MGGLKASSLTECSGALRMERVADPVTTSALYASLALQRLLMTRPQPLVRRAAQSYSLFIHLF